MATTQPKAAERTPRLVPGVDQRSLPIGPEEAFVLSRVDGKTTQADISSATGLDGKAVAEILDRLIEVGAIRLDADNVAADPPTEPPRQGTASAVARKLERPVMESTVERRFDDLESAALYDPGELDEDCDLDLARKRSILDLYYRLDQLDHYALLELKPDAEKKDVKAAYFRYVNVFHPDKYYGKSVGSFRPKLERVFVRLTEAHDTLTRKKTRQEYDEYLASRRRNRALERALYGERDHYEELDRAHRKIHAAARPGRPRRDPRVDDDEPTEMRQERLSWPVSQVEPAEERATGSPGDRRADPIEPDPKEMPSEATSRAPSEEATPPPREAADASDADSSPQQAASARPSAPPPDPDARKRAFARRMRRGTTSVPPPPLQTAPPPHPSETKRQVADDLKRMYSNRIRGARDNQVQVYLDAAKTALSEENPVAAANALRVAAALAPDDDEVGRRLAEVEHQANVKLGSNYLEQAQYEEKELHWAEAAKSYQRAALGSPTARVHERVAFCLLKAGGDMKLASEHGKEAVKLAPNQASMRVTLAEVYLKAGMRQSAIAEFERAQALAPHDDTIKDWLKRIRRNQV